MNRKDLKTRGRNEGETMVCPFLGRISPQGREMQAQCAHIFACVCVCVCASKLKAIIFNKIQYIE